MLILSKFEPNYPVRRCQLHKLPTLPFSGATKLPRRENCVRRASWRNNVAINLKDYQPRWVDHVELYRFCLFGLKELETNYKVPKYSIHKLLSGTPYCLPPSSRAAKLFPGEKWLSLKSWFKEVWKNSEKKFGTIQKISML